MLTNRFKSQLSSGVVLSTIFFVAIVAVSFRLHRINKPSIRPVTVSPTIAPTPTSSLWLNYKSSDIAFQYPPQYVISNDSENICLYLPQNSDTCQFLLRPIKDTPQSKEQKTPSDTIHKYLNHSQQIFEFSGPSSLLETFNQILFTLKFVETTPFPTPAAISQPIPAIKIDNTSDWSDQTCGQLSFKAPAEYDIKCLTQTEGDAAFIIKKGDLKWSFYLAIQSLDGQDATKFWSNKLSSDSAKIKMFTRSKTQQFGNNRGVDYFADVKYWQTQDPSPILLSFNDQIVVVLGGRNFDSQTGTISRSSIADTVASTVILTGLPANQKIFCGGIAGRPCPAGYTCQLDGKYPDAGGNCVR